MPTSAPRPCQGRCGKPSVPGRARCIDCHARHAAEAEARLSKRRSEQGWRRFYRTAAWRQRSEEQRRRVPACQRCGATDGLQAAHAGETPHTWDGFISAPLVTLCARCHASSRAHQNWRRTS